MKSERLLFAALLLSIVSASTVFAQTGSEVTVDGINYTLNKDTREAMIALGSYSGEIVIPEYIWPVDPGSQDGLAIAMQPYWGGYRVTSYFYQNASGVITTPFTNNAYITKVQLPPSIRAIKDGTFLNCTQLEEVKLVGCFFTNNNPTGNQVSSDVSTGVFTGCTNLKRLYVDDPRVMRIGRKKVGNSYVNYCPLANVLGSNTTSNLFLNHNSRVHLSSLLKGIVTSEQTTFDDTQINVSTGFFPSGDVSVIDYDYAKNVSGCTIQENVYPITAKEMTFDCPKQGSITIVLSNVPDGNSAYLKPYIKVGDAEPVPMSIFSDASDNYTFYYTVYANPNAATDVSLMYKCSSTWGRSLIVETPGNINVYVDNVKKIYNSQDAGNYEVADPIYPFTTYEIALWYDTLRYEVKAFDKYDNEYPFMRQSGFLRQGIYYFNTTGSADDKDYWVRLQTIDIPMQIWFTKPRGIKLTVSATRKGIPYTQSYNNPTNLFSADPEQPVTLKLENVHEDLIPYVIAYRERLELDTLMKDGVKYYEASFVPHYGSSGDITIGTTQKIEDGEILAVNITKVGDGYVWIKEPNEDWYEALDEDNPGQLEDMETDGEEQSFQWPYAFNEGDIQNITFIAPMPVATGGIVESVRVNVNGADVPLDHVQESGNLDGEKWYYFKVPINDNLDIQLIHETNARHLSVKNGDGNGSIKIYNPDGEQVLSVMTNQATSGEYLVRQPGYYAIIEPKTGKEVSAIFTTGMQQLLPPASYLQGDNIYYVPLAGFETNTISDYQLSVLYADGAVGPWISYHHEGLIGSLGSLINKLPESQKNAIEQLSVNMNMRASDLKAIRYLGGKPDYYTKPDTQGSLYSLDLTDAAFYESDELFYTDETKDYKINTRNVMPYGFLNGLHLETLYLPKALVGFEEGALANVNDHLVVYAPWKTPLDLSETSGFGDEVANMDLWVPAGSFEAYAADDEWGKFGFIWEYGTADPVDIIQFADTVVKRICVENWDTNGDGELSKAEAAKVTTLIDGTTNKSVFYNKNNAITSFDEFQYFTGLTKVEEQAFYVDSIKSIVLPPTITSIEKEAFYGCRIQTIDIPEGVTSIGQSAFNSCANLENIVLPKSLTSIGSYAFAYTSIRQIFIPKNVNSITPGVGANIFSGCSKLVSIDVDKDNGSYDSRDNCSAIIEKTASGGTLVYGCKNSIVPDGVNKIGIQAFKSAGIKKMVIPSSVTSISIFVFADNMLDTLVMKRETPIAFDKRMFIASSAETTPASISNCVLVVPAGTKDAYATSGWKSKEDGGYFKEVVEEVRPAYFDVNGDGLINVSDVTALVNKILHP